MRRETRSSRSSTIPAKWGKCTIAEPLSETSVKVTCEHGDLSARVSNSNVIFSPIVNADQRCAP